MPIRLTDELKAQALEVASLYEPLAPPVLVGSCVWLCEELRQEVKQRKDLHGEYAKA